MNATKNAASVLALAIFCLGPQAAPAASNISFSGTYSDRLVNDPMFGPTVATAASATMNLTLPLNGFDITTFVPDTELDINVTGGTGGGASLSDTLGEDPKFKAGSKTATIHNVDANGGNYTLVVTWTASTLTVTASFTDDSFSFESTYGTPGMPGTTKINDIYDVSVALGDFSYDDPNVFVTGANTDKEVAGQDGLPYSLENGSVSGAADFTPPALSISSPGATAKTATGLVVITGKASDNVGLAGVFCTVNSNTDNILQISGPYDVNPKSASVQMTNDFSQNPDFIAGTNLLQFYAIDTSSNVSSVVTAYVFWVQPTNMTVLTSGGPGTVSGLRTGQIVNMGEGYPVTANPGSGYVLESWTDSSGDDITSNPSFNYFVGENDGGATLIANFVPNPYAALKGAYTGLFFDPANGVTPTNAGYITLTLTTNGSYSGAIYLGAAKYPITGQFQFPNDYAQGDTGSNYSYPVVKLNSQTEMEVALFLNMDTNLADPGAGFLTGTVSAYGNGVGLDTNYWEAPLTAELSQYLDQSGRAGALQY